MGASSSFALSFSLLDGDPHSRAFPRKPYLLNERKKHGNMKRARWFRESIVPNFTERCLIFGTWFSQSHSAFSFFLRRHAFLGEPVKCQDQGLRHPSFGSVLQACPDDPFVFMLVPETCQSFIIWEVINTHARGISKRYGVWLLIRIPSRRREDKRDHTCRH